MGEDKPDQPHDPQLSLHLQAWALLKNGMGGLDWAGLPYVVTHLGITDVPALIDALKTIKTYIPETSQEDAPPEPCTED